MCVLMRMRQHWWGERRQVAAKRYGWHMRRVSGHAQTQVWIPRGWTGTLDFASDEVGPMGSRIRTLYSALCGAGRLYAGRYVLHRHEFEPVLKSGRNFGTA